MAGEAEKVLLTGEPAEVSLIGEQKMKDYAIVYSSSTGNTRQLAEVVKAGLEKACSDKTPEQGQAVLEMGKCLYFGEAGEEAARRAQEAEVVFAGFWTDKGTCHEQMADFLKTLRGKQVFLFGTAGFGESEGYFSQILSRVKENLDSSNTCGGSWMCQGRMPQAVRRRYEAMLETEPQRAKMLIQNFDNALSHPDEQDQEKLLQTVIDYFSRI